MKDKTIKLKDYDVSQECGFLPTVSPAFVKLPEAFGQLQQTAVMLPKLLITNKIRQAIKSVPEVDVDNEILDEMQLRRLILLYSFLSHAYVWGESTPAKILPRNIAVPFHKIAQKMGRQPILSYASYILENWVRIDNQKPIASGNIMIAQNFLDVFDENWFVLMHLDIEIKATPSLAAIPSILEGIGRDDVSTVMSALKDIKNAWTNINSSMNRMLEGCDPYIFYNRIRPYLKGWKNNDLLSEGLIYQGVVAYGDKPQKLLGASGAQSAIVPAMDALLNITNESNSFREYLIEMRDYMPPKHRAFVEAVEKHSTLRNFVKNRLNQSPKLTDLYNDCVFGMEKFRTQHLKLAAHYINQEAIKVNNNTGIGTGGTPFMRYLKKNRDACRHHKLSVDGVHN
ncbi:MAG: hypothetical protein QNJ34_19010 [Xenococcaceae cyanobacterium MO_188.B29]|nr:hypothetical protein [Xenococcaceae cyanobacterium MO_188.B29]